MLEDTILEQMKRRQDEGRRKVEAAARAKVRGMEAGRGAAQG